ncbi:MAG: AbgT family transporter [Verrucomicrobiota bacterium]|nr:AbgT family transporter [Verrucomicrobiota bacterium]
MANSSASNPTKTNDGWLGWIEKVGNRLPDPATLFLIGTILVMIASAVAVKSGWVVHERLPDHSAALGQTAAGSQVAVKWIETGDTFEAKNILTRDGLFWAISSMVENFINFAPLGIVLVGMLGIGIAERTGFIGSALKAMLMVVPQKLLTPAMVFLGIMSSMTSDAGYIILPPLAAALYKAVGRAPLAGLAAVFAGVAAGFNANLVITSLDPMLSDLATMGAQVIDPNYEVNPACNLWFMIASTIVMTGVGWFVADVIVEKRLANKSAEEGGPSPVDVSDLESQRLTLEDKRALKIAGIVFAIALTTVIAMVNIPGSPLYTYELESPIKLGKMVTVEVVEVVAGDPLPAGAIEKDGQVFVQSKNIFPRWVKAIVPLVLIVFIIPGIVYGVLQKKIHSDRDVAKLLTDSMAGMAPIIVMAFFAGQFVEHFKYSGLDKMVAMPGGHALGQAALPTSLLIVAFILMTMCFNMFVGSMSAKYTIFAPIFIPMFMMVNISPELTQCAYRIGDSVTNCITPLNPYMVILLAFMKNIAPKGGMGTLISTMLPFTIIFSIVWTIMLLVWFWLGIPLGLDGHLNYSLPN